MSPIYRRIIIFFASAIIIGTTILSSPFVLADKTMMPTLKDMLLRGIFTATSAVCVTGLSVVDIGSYYNHLGQIVILCLIQVGALGYVLFATASGIIFGRLPLKERLAIKEVVEPDSYEGLLSLLKNIIKIVVVIEGIGAIILSMLFARYFTFLKSVYYGIFHAVSAFANAGFSLFPANLEIFNQDIFIMLTVSVLIILGGLGFLVISEIMPFGRSKHANESEDVSINGGKEKRFNRYLSLHTRMVLIISGILIIAGGVLFFIFENSNPSVFISSSPTYTAGDNAQMSFGYKVANAFFMSVTSRTAGFNTLKVARFLPVTLFVLIIFMFIGASPGGTGGGIKSTTFGVVLLWIITFIRRKNEINISGRRIPFEVVRKALNYMLLALFYCVVAVSAILFFEKNKINPLWCCFEVVSAFGTVGLSTGITPQLSALSQITIIITMLVGRVGLLTLALSALGAGTNGRKELIQYPEERVLVG